MIDRIKEAISNFVTEKDENEENEDQPRLVIVDPSTLSAPEAEQPESYLLGLFAEVAEEKVAELIHALLVVADETKKQEEEERIPVDFYLST